MKANYPNSREEVGRDASECERCTADFSDPNGWRPTAEPVTARPQATVLRTTAQTIGRLVAAVLVWFALTVAAVVAGCIGGYSADSVWCVLMEFIAIVLVLWTLLWTLLPVIEIAGQRK
jgi:hypothetical protein